ncbi:UDP-3-O-(3-hydroxymyristoyl)glucosamine N-acyltransferase [Parasulfitobacter algicola]|uniref:UDP-3-O-acylglucosamine N-acyltransferase n=1 Tax=Parasulfitobacter algicola TaxID=2614809 RepID=A0ABX2IY39_9RHOB|nr:UDP-3-O-(3-hydroxymyristoyl)glucosamine N-acyltransferase [Sulfitobacter algicola]NSX55348.1 UDP-3-O-(3-hydroxymyristoyl)glucosamine N-acyltransferase [Sulfitobacter algicola]
MAHTVKQIAAALGAEAFGAVDLLIEGAAEPAMAGPTQIALAMDPKYGEGLAKGHARAAILWAGADWQELGLDAAIFVPRPRYAMSGLTTLLDAGPDIATGIHPSAIIDPSAHIGANAAIGPLVVIGRDVTIGDNARIAAHTVISEATVIGDDAMILQGVKIGARVQIGDRFIAQPGAVIGSDGFSFVTPEKSGVENVRETLGDQKDAKAQSWTRIHSLGTVEIANDVEIGANTAIDRGTIRATKIGRGTKLDNLVHIGHNIQIGEDCLICGQVGMAGSSTIGNRVVMAGQCGVNDNIFVGDDVIAGGATKIFTNAPAGRVLLGYPAMKMETHVEAYKGLRRLSRLFRDVADLKKAVSKPEQND